MACKNCKQKERIKKELMKTEGQTPKQIKVIFLLLSFFSIYGFVSFIFDLIKWVF